jgi:hypothetical protein
MTSITSAGVLQKRNCEADDRQFCCALEKNPNQKILPNLYLFAYGLGCSKSDNVSS